MTANDPARNITFNEYVSRNRWPNALDDRSGDPQTLRVAIVPFLSYFGNCRISEGPSLPGLVAFSRLVGEASAHAALQLLWDATEAWQTAEARRLDVRFQPSPAAAHIPHASNGRVPVEKPAMRNAFAHCVGELGLRPVEAVSLQWQDIDRDTDRVVVSGAGGQPKHRARTVILFPETRWMLETHLKHTTGTGYVFQNRASRDRSSLPSGRFDRAAAISDLAAALMLRGVDVGQMSFPSAADLRPDGGPDTTS